MCAGTQTQPGIQRNVDSVSAPDDARSRLLDLLLEARTLVARPDNDFMYSSWLDTDHALAEIDGLLAKLTAGGALPHAAISMILLPTGPMQELATDSGWGDEFVELASEIDDALSHSGD